jgi:hypothetical protein
MKLLSLFIALIVVSFLAACGDDDDSASETSAPAETTPAIEASPTEPPQATGDCAPNTAGPAAARDLTWDAIVPASIPAPDGWSVEGAEGDAPLLAVSNGEDVVGTIELLKFEVPFEPSGGYEAMETWVDIFYHGVQTDREAVGLNISLDNPDPVPFGGFCGMAYGYTVFDDEDVPIERYAGRATYDPTNLYLVVAIYDEALAEEMGFQSLEALTEFEPSLTPLVESLDVPVP